VNISSIWKKKKTDSPQESLSSSEERKYKKKGKKDKIKGTFKIHYSNLKED